MTKSILKNMAILFAIVIAMVLIPFFIFHEQFDSWAMNFMNQPYDQTIWIIGLIIFLLAADILLPIPSTILSTGAGYIFGIVGGTLVSFVGMTLGVLVGYLIGYSSRNTLPWLDEKTTTWLESFFNKNGIWAIALARPVPVIAETSVIFAGMSKMSPTKYIVISSLSNLGISLVYAGIGAYSVSTNSFLFAFIASITIPFFWAIFQIVKRKNKTLVS